jgi:hypothetical protein
LNIFPESKNSNDRSFPVGIEAESFQAVARDVSAGPALPAAILGELFSRAWGGGGGQKSGILRHGTAGQGRIFRRGIGRIFFLDPSLCRDYTELAGLFSTSALSFSPQKNAAKFRVGGWS